MFKTGMTTGDFWRVVNPYFHQFFAQQHYILFFFKRIFLIHNEILVFQHIIIKYFNIYLFMFIQTIIPIIMHFIPINAPILLFFTSSVVLVIPSADKSDFFIIILVNDCLSFCFIWKKNT